MTQNASHPTNRECPWLRFPVSGVRGRQRRPLLFVGCESTRDSVAPASLARCVAHRTDLVFARSKAHTRLAAALLGTKEERRDPFCCIAYHTVNTHAQYTSYKYLSARRRRRLQRKRRQNRRRRRRAAAATGRKGSDYVIHSRWDVHVGNSDQMSLGCPRPGGSRSSASHVGRPLGGHTE